MWFGGQYFGTWMGGSYFGGSSPSSSPSPSSGYWFQAPWFGREWFGAAAFWDPTEPLPTETFATVEKVIDLGVILPASLISTTINEESLHGSGMMVQPELLYSLNGVDYTSGGLGLNTIYATNFRFIKSRYNIAAPNDKTLSKFSAHTYTVQVKKTTDSGMVQVLTHPTPVLFGVDFVDVQSVVPSLMGGRSGSASADFLDIPYPTGFDMYCFDVDGNPLFGAGVFASWVAGGAVAPSF